MARRRVHRASARVKGGGGSSTPPGSGSSGVGLAMTQVTANRIIQRQTTTGGVNGKGVGTIPVAITLIAQADTIEYRLRDYTTDAVVQDWTTAATNVASSTTSINCPNAPAYLGWYKVDLRANQDNAQIVLGTTPVGVGRLIAVSGQSLAVRMVRTIEDATTMAALGVSISPNCAAFVTYTDGATSNTAAWGLVSDSVPYNSAFAGEFLRLQVAAAGVNCGLIGYALGGSQLSAHVANNPPIVPVITAAGGLEAFIWFQGHSDTGLGAFPYPYTKSLERLISVIAAANTARGTNFDKLIGNVPNITHTGYGTRRQIQRMWVGVRDWCVAKGYQYVQPADLELLDGVHQKQTGSRALARHFHRASRPGLGLVGDHAGPSITGWTRANGSRDVVLAVSLPSGATTLVSQGNPAPRFAVYNAGDTTTPLALDATTPITVGTNTITLKLASPPADGQLLDVYAFPAVETANGNSGCIYDDHLDGDGLTVGRQLQTTIATFSMTGYVETLGNVLVATSPVYGSGATGFGQAKTVGGVLRTFSAFDHIPGDDTWTLECRFLLPATPAGTVIVVGSTSKIYIAADTVGKIKAVYGNAATFADATVGPTTGRYDDNVWHHVAFVCSPTRRDLFIDGVLVGSNTTTAAALAVLNPLGIGQLGGGGFSWPGSVDEVAVWKIAKYTAPFTPPSSPYVGNETGLIALWHLDGNGDPVSVS